MFEAYLVCEAGFKNVRDNGRIVGFQVKSRISNWRGMPLSLIEDLGVTVDGEKFPRNSLRVNLGGHDYSLDDMKDKVDARWQFDEIATITVQKPGGLAPGLHDVEVTQQFRTGLAALSPSLASHPVPTVGKRRMTLTA
jgi:Domain of unknown function (DUF6379)